MLRILIIADDFTGALDTSVRLAAAGARVKVIPNPDAELSQHAEGADCLVIDAETRHLPAEAAYRTVQKIAAQAKRLDVPHIFKKTDSALRGNIGAELAALLDASGERTLHFLPAYPEMGRTTVNGIQLIDGVPVAQSVFGKDPFEPVRESEIARIIRSQSSVPVASAQPGTCSTAPGIAVYDAATPEELEQTGDALSESGQLRVLAGCAGFGAILPALLGLTSERPAVLPELDPRLLVICGSVNPITLAQLSTAEQSGFLRARLSPEQKLDPQYWQSAEGKTKLTELRELLETHPRMIIDANDLGGNAATAAYADAQRLDLEEVRLRISASLGKILAGLFDSPALGTLLVTGGDTLLQCMQTMGIHELEPICELQSGVVLSRFAYHGKSRYVISKSGGFGSRELLTELIKQ